MKNTLHLAILVMFSIMSPNSAASESQSLDDNPWRYINIEQLPLSWFTARWEAERVSHILDILLTLDDGGCEKTRAMLEHDLRKYQSTLKSEVNKIQEAEAKGKITTVVTELGKQDKLSATAALKRAEQYWSDRSTKLNASHTD